MSNEKSLSYTEALAELERIIKELESEEIDVDILTEKVKRADYLCKYCLSRLRKIEDEVQTIIKDIDQAQELDDF
ncbi:MAG: exodeoxyribonuclease VII small subunit [Thermodesulfovibrionales bacterium]|nr:exodeoxyribonuclease VII small subunit [Thermodesulfovibrionales bacterium]